jgi:protein-disulfide isomerase
MKSLSKDFLFIGKRWRLATPVLVPFALAGVMLWHSFPAYWQYRPIEFSVKLQSGRTTEGYPWIGSDNAELVITEFTDYMCFQCNKIHSYLRRLMNRYPEKIKLIHRHFPMDSEFNPIVKIPFHEGAGKLALLAIQAEKEGKFWPVNDELYARALKTNLIEINALAEGVGLNPEVLQKSLIEPTNLRKLNHDIIGGLKLGISGTPSFVIDGKIYTSQIPADLLARIRE